ncbi:neutrophil gelatinase-associated lipocalin [Nothobranchius furzeri]|uniref:Lipocalin 2 n=3 Tax=Nothobranchius TaxID=28779 RepID=A0A1A7ZPP4_NOTFU|nr:prostaglandin D2 synthase a [Nothobranchius furzeri]XP_054600231.1 prostaglandin D2 synthase a [Nothobranchius furzeri]KAF7216954.1 lipocalin 2 [Nothobranchius furzeri]
MRTTVISVVMAMMYVMVAPAAVKPQKDFNVQKFTGKWYRVGLAYDSPGFVPLRTIMKISVGVISVLPNGNVNLTSWEAVPVGCLTQSYLYERTSIPGQFTYFSTRHNQEKDITVVETNYTEYALVVKHKEFNREYTQVALYGRSSRVRAEVIQKFKALALSQGFPRESILTPPPAENCPPGSGR